MRQLRCMTSEDSRAWLIWMPGAAVISSLEPSAPRRFAPAML